MGWKNWSYGLKGGIIGFFVGVLSFFVVPLFLFVLGLLIWAGYFGRSMIVHKIYRIIDWALIAFRPSMEFFFLQIFFGFVFGAIIGFIYGKVKARSK